MLQKGKEQEGDFQTDKERERSAKQAFIWNLGSPDIAAEQLNFGLKNKIVNCELSLNESLRNKLYYGAHELIHERISAQTCLCSW